MQAEDPSADIKDLGVLRYKSTGVGRDSLGKGGCGRVTRAAHYICGLGTGRPVASRRDDTERQPDPRYL